MNAGLIYLIHQAPRAKLRQIVRRMKGVKGVLSTLVVGLLLFAMIGPQFLLSDPNPASIAKNIERARYWGPPLLLVAFFILGISTGNLMFKPPEIAFLFPAPVSRRQLLIFHIVSRLQIVVLSALWCSIFLARHAPHFGSAFFSLLFGLTFLHLMSQISGLVFSTVGEKFSSRIRGFILLGFLAFLAVCVFWLKFKLPSGTNFLEIGRRIVDSNAVRAVSVITLPFIEVFVAETLPHFFLWSAAVVFMIGIQIMILLGLDIAYTESALALSQKVQNRLNNMRAGGSVWSAGKPAKATGGLRMFPYWKGAGPIAWRQALEIQRSFRSILIGSLIFLFMPIMLGIAQKSTPEAPPIVDLLLPLIFITAMGMMMSQQFTYDFHRDLDRMAILKSLPISPFPLALGQILPNAFLHMTYQSLAILIYLIFQGHDIVSRLILLLIVLWPLNFSSIAIDNLIFLLMPYRGAVKEAGQMPFMGRIMMVMFIKMMVLAVVIIFSFGMAALGWYYIEKSILLAACISGCWLLLSALPFIGLTALAFKHFDVSKDIPG